MTLTQWHALSLSTASHVFSFKSLISQLLSIYQYRLCSRQYEVHSRWLVTIIRPSMDRASLDAGVTLLHVNYDAIVKSAVA